MSELEKGMKQELGLGHGVDPQTGEPEVEQDNFVSGSDVLNELNGIPPAEQEEDKPVKIKTQWGDLTPEELVQKLEDTENKRRGFQSEADILRKQVAMMGNQPKQQQQPKQEKEKLSPPNIEKFLEGIDENDVLEVSKAQAKYYEAVREYDKKILAQEMDARIERERRRNETMLTVNKLAELDDEFRNPDGSVNIQAIETFVQEETSDLVKLYEKTRGNKQSEPEKTTVISENQLQPVNPQNMTVSKGYRSLASTGNKPGANTSNSRIPKYIGDIAKLYGNQIDLPPGAKLIRE